MNYILILLLIHHVKSKFSEYLVKINLYSVYNSFAFFYEISFITYFSIFFILYIFV